jgi:phosphoribosylamine--glycine ligase
MKVLVIGGGGREHALVWKLKQSPLVKKIWCAPGNGGIAAEAECIPVDVGDVASLTKIANQLSPDLTIVGPELPLVNGVADAFAAKNWPIIGPSRQAAQLEGSKIFTKQFLLRHEIPTAKLYGTFDSSQEAYAALEDVRWPLVIKADGLCGGKGVFLAPDKNAARDFIERAMEKSELGAGAKRIMLEETLAGEELSFIIITDGRQYAPLVPTRDHKRVFDGDLGPNTGGMGAYSTDELLPDELRNRILSQLVEPTLAGLKQDGIAYEGFLYFGLMLTKNGPKILEFNCRLGDPETQAILARVDFDLAEILKDVSARRLNPGKLKWKPGASACVVLTAGGYPGKFETGEKIHGLTSIRSDTGVKALHAGTRLEGNDLVTAGGRVLGLVATGNTVDMALAAVYRATQDVQFAGMHYRKDIGLHARQSAVGGD